MAKDLLWNGMLFRILSTILGFTYLYLNRKGEFISKYFNIIVVALLMAFDFFDSKDKYFNKDFEKFNKTFQYQIIDKIIDLISYIYVYVLFFQGNTMLLYIILYRLIGLILFMYTRNSTSIIVFFDFFKEYLVYLYIVKGGKNQQLLTGLVVAKMIFEYIHHKYNNSVDYTKNVGGLLHRK